MPKTDHPQTPGLQQESEVVAGSRRRRLSVGYKLKVLETVQALRTQGHGAIGAYLRKEGLYYSSVRTWERLHAEGKLTSSPPGTKQKGRQELLAENKRLRRQQQQLEQRLKKAELIIELQKKLSRAMEQSSGQETGEP